MIHQLESIRIFHILCVTSVCIPVCLISWVSLQRILYLLLF